MINAFVFFGVTFTVLWSVAPRFFRYCDAMLVRQRLRPAQDDRKQTAPGLTKDPRSVPQQVLSPRHFNDLARLTRAHLPLRDAIQQLAVDIAPEILQALMDEFAHQGSLENERRGSRPQQQDVSYHLLLASISDGVFIPAALDEAARLLRELQRTHGDLEIASAQARLTMKVLTRTPLFLLVVLTMTSHSFRNVVTSPGVLIVILIAVALNRIGTMWSTHLIHRITEPSPVDEILDLTSVLSVHLRAGLSLPSACLRLAHLNSHGRLIAQAINDGRTFDEALQPLQKHVHRFGHDVATLLTSAYRDGQPAVEIIGILSDEARQLRDQETHIRIRKLPTQLSAPVVLCALPAFMLLIVVPMFLSQLHAISGSLHVVSS